LESLKSLLAFGYHIGVDVKVDERRLKYIKLPNSYAQSNGYKPQPLDLSNINLSTKMDELIEVLAENTHNIWAAARIKDGFTYGVADVSRLECFKKMTGFPCHQNRRFIMPINCAIYCDFLEDENIFTKSDAILIK
jgi:hypothetical protein